MQDFSNADPLIVKKKYQINCIIFIIAAISLGLCAFLFLQAEKFDWALVAVVSIVSLWLLNKSYFAIKYQMIGSFFIFPRYGRAKLNKYIGFFFLVLAMILVAIGLWFSGSLNFRQTGQSQGVASTQVTGWKTYTNSEYGFTFEYPPDAQVVKDQTYTKTSTDAYFVFVKNGFRQLVFISEKDPKQSLIDWYNNNHGNLAKSPGEILTKPIQKKINGYDAIEVYSSYMEASTKTVYLANKNLVAEFYFNVISENSTLTADQQKFLDSFKFTK